jgi:hypothetical protein
MDREISMTTIFHTKRSRSPFDHPAHLMKRRKNEAGSDLEDLFDYDGESCCGDDPDRELDAQQELDAMKDGLCAEYKQLLLRILRTCYRFEDYITIDYAACDGILDVELQPCRRSHANTSQGIDFIPSKLRTTLNSFRFGLMSSVYFGFLGNTVIQ